MYQINSSVINDMIDDGTVFGAYLSDTSSGEVIMGDVLFEVDTDSSATTLSDDIELGCIDPQRMNISMRGDVSFLGREFGLSLFVRDKDKQTAYADLTPYTHEYLSHLKVDQIPYLAEILEGELIPMGVFTVVKALRNGELWELTLYDKLYFADKTFDKSAVPPTGMRAAELEQAALSQLGLESEALGGGSGELCDSEGRALLTSQGLSLVTASFDFFVYPSQIPEGSSCRQILSWVASAHGQFGCVDRFGKYDRRWYSRPVKTLDPDTIDLPTLSEKPNTIVGVVCRVDDSTTLSFGRMSGGRVLEFENPFMTADLLRSIFTQIKNYTWYTAQMYMRLGDPRFDIGDTLTYKSESGAGCSIPVTSLAYRFDGGLSADITAAGISVEEQIEI